MSKSKQAQYFRALRERSEEETKEIAAQATYISEKDAIKIMQSDGALVFTDKGHAYIYLHTEGAAKHVKDSLTVYRPGVVQNGGAFMRNGRSGAVGLQITPQYAEDLIRTHEFPATRVARDIAKEATATEAYELLHRKEMDLHTFIRTLKANDGVVIAKNKAPARVFFPNEAKASTVLEMADSLLQDKKSRTQLWIDSDSVQDITVVELALPMHVREQLTKKIELLDKDGCEIPKEDEKSEKEMAAVWFASLSGKLESYPDNEVTVRSMQRDGLRRRAQLHASKA